MIRDVKATTDAVQQPIRLVGTRMHLRGEDVCAASDGHDAINGAQVSGKGAIVGIRTKDEFRESLDCMRWFRCEIGSHSRSNGVQK